MTLQETKELVDYIFGKIGLIVILYFLFKAIKWMIVQK